MNITTTTKHIGSCHCGKVTFEANIDARDGTRCNCTICMKLGAVGKLTKPEAIRIVAGEDALASYAITPGMQRFFCKHCGIYLYGKGFYEQLGGAFASVNLNVLDDIDPGLLPVKHWDGRHNNWQAGLRDEAWPIA